MSLFDATIPQFKKMLSNLERWLDAGVELAKKKSADPNTLLTLRLAVDQYPLVRQIQAACDSAKSTAAHLSGKEVPKHPDTETTIEEIQTRIKTVLAYLDTFTPADLEGAGTREIRLPFLPGMIVYGEDYVTEMALPNFYFHITTAYAILRHAGVDIGKRDYIGSLKLHEDKPKV